MKETTILGAIAGDMIGAVYAYKTADNYNFPLLLDYMVPTDDSVMICAVAEWLLKASSYSPETLAPVMREWGKKHLLSFDSRWFLQWITEAQDIDIEKECAGNFFFSCYHLTRVIPIGFATNTMEKTLRIADIPAGIMGILLDKEAQVIAACIFMAKMGTNKGEIHKYITENFGDEVELGSIEVCKKNQKYLEDTGWLLSAAITAFMESSDYEDAIRKAVLMGGKSDIICCLTGGMAAAFYKEIPDEIYDFVWGKMGEDMREVVTRFEEKYNQ